MENDNLKQRIVKIVHYLYDKEYVSEDAILLWHENMEDDNSLKNTLKQLVDWLNQSSEEESDDE